MIMPAPELPTPDQLKKMEPQAKERLPVLKTAFKRMCKEEEDGNPLLADNYRQWRAWYTAVIAHLETFLKGQKP